MGGPAVFSLPLALWGLSLLLFRSALCLVCVGQMFQFSQTPDVGTKAFLCSAAGMMFATNLAQIAIGIKSELLTEILHELSNITEVPCSSTKRWYCKPKTLWVGAATISLVVGMEYICTFWGFTNSLEALTLFFWNQAFIANLFVSSQLPSMVFGLLSRRLVAATEATAATVSTLLAPDGSFKSEGDVNAAMLALRDLDAVICEV